MGKYKSYKKILSSVGSRNLALAKHSREYDVPSPCSQCGEWFAFAA